MNDAAIGEFNYNIPQITELHDTRHTASECKTEQNTNMKMRVLFLGILAHKL
jgi:hypothetical protein